MLRSKALYAVLLAGGIFGLVWACGDVDGWHGAALCAGVVAVLMGGCGLIGEYLREVR